MKFALAFAVASALASGQAIAGPVTTVGGTDCGKWTLDTTVTRKAWLLGFISGMNSLHVEEGLSPPNPLGDYSAEQLFAWMNNYCAKHPLNTVRQGAVELFGEMKTRSQ